MTRRTLPVAPVANISDFLEPEPHDILRVMIDTVREDVHDISEFYKVTFSPTRTKRLTKYLKDKLTVLDSLDYERLDQQSQVDAVLLRKWIKRQLQLLNEAASKHEALGHLVQPFLGHLTDLIDCRQKVERTDGQWAAQVLSKASQNIRDLKADLNRPNPLHVSREDCFIAYRAVGVLNEIRAHLVEWFQFYNGYDPILSWWVKAPYNEIDVELQEYANLIREKLVGIRPGDEDAIVGQPVGRDALLTELENGVIAYSPEDLIRLAEQEYKWCENEAIKAATALGHGKDWRAALEQVKNKFVPPGEQTYLVHDLSNEAIAYVKKHDMITIPEIAEECWATTMMTPARQKVNPFFLGGKKMIISYPTNTMSHEDKMMSLRGNAPSLSRSTVFHELIPGHHLQFHSFARYRPYRQLFMTEYWTEGWAFYWEMRLWDHGFVVNPEDKIGMLFWRMHRCIRIIFSLKFHLGLMTPQECIDILVEKVGHERATAEGEVRRSFNGDYPPLYQAGYMVGALQFYALRRELVEGAGWPEKLFHGAVMKQGTMSIEILRALLKKQKLEPDHKADWKFYNFE